MGLGAEIRRQLGETTDHDLLTSWMAEYLGEKLAEFKRARGKQREALEKECAELILTLWDRRHQLPNGARPLESFEPIFVALNELSQDKPRYSVLRNLPPTSKKSKVGNIIQGVLAIDQSASALIRYFLAEAVEKIPKSDKRWADIGAEIKPSTWDIHTVRLLIQDAEAISDKLENPKSQQRTQLKEMLERLEYFEKSTASLRALLEKKINSAK